MLEVKKYNNKINNIFNYYYDLINNNNVKNLKEFENIINLLFLIIFNILFLLNKLIKQLHNFIDQYITYKKNYIQLLNNINIELDNNHNILLERYNNTHQINTIIKYENIINNMLLFKNKKNNINIISVYNNTNLNIISLINISSLIECDDETNTNNFPSNMKYDYVDIGYNNLYKLHIFDKMDSTIPFNLLVYIKELNQVLIKIGNEKNYQYINSKLYRAYDLKNNINTLHSIDNYRSILCNNNIKKLNKKCNNGIQCKYYHDFILGYHDNFHTDRQFSYNPIIYNCIDFKDGSKVKENIKKIKWHDAINLYQFNLSCLLIGCIHSLNKEESF